MGGAARRVLLVAAAAFVAACDGATDLCPVQLSYVPASGASVERVRAVGDLPGSPLALRRQPGGWFGVALDVAPGDHLYRLEVDGSSTLDPRAPLSLFDEDGVEQSLLRVEDCRLPRWEVRRAEGSTTGGGSVVVEAELVAGRDGDRLDPETVEAELRGGEAVEVEAAAEAVTIRADGLGPGKHGVLLRGADLSGRQAEELLVPVWVEEEPFDWEGALIYQVMVDRFALSGEPLDAGLPRDEAIRVRRGGDLLGLAEVVRSGYFEHLGVRALWITPVYDNPEELYPGNDGRDYAGYHGYWPVDEARVEPMIGGEAALEELVAELHGRGMRLVVDVVPNHVHIESPLYLEHRGEWFNGDGECVCGVTCSWSTDIDHCWFTPYLADLDWRIPAVVDEGVGNVMFWLEAFDLDGLRVDAVPMMPRLAVRHIAWAASRRFEQGPVSLHLLGETYTGPDGWRTIAQYIGPFGLDGQFDFPVLWEARIVLAEGASTMASLDRAIRESERTWGGSGAVMSPIAGNHDVPRFLTIAAGSDLSDPWASPPEAPDDDEPYERLLLAHALTLTLPGAPILYYGDEIGMPGAGDPDNRRPMRFDEELSEREARLLEAVSRLGRGRACSAALRNGARTTLLATDDEYAYLRDAADGRPAVVLIGRSDETRRVTVDLPGDLALETDRLTDLLTGAEVAVMGAALEPIDLPPRTAMVLVPGGGCD